ncbi:hypothetical protein AB6A40_006237 [Gnathostoma spinigerum]|uniref:SHSP domain-containing protein n=1 Tax=Gnathostoma spinigerum TaxID=75299 RepID=A0ABD6ER90_9BILA
MYRSFMSDFFNRCFDEVISDLDRPYICTIPSSLVQPDVQNDDRNGIIVTRIVNTAQKFTIEMDVSKYRPEELTITLDGQQLVIRGQQIEPYLSSSSEPASFVRNFTLPDDVATATLESSFSESGVLCIEAEKCINPINSESQLTTRQHVSSDGQNDSSMDNFLVSA